MLVDNVLLSLYFRAELFPWSIFNISPVLQRTIPITTEIQISLISVVLELTSSLFAYLGDFSEKRKCWRKVNQCQKSSTSGSIIFKTLLFFADMVSFLNDCEQLNLKEFQKCKFSVEKRNSRERHRVQAINDAFKYLRMAVPSIAYRSKRLSKVKTLRRAIQYINELENILTQ